ncbi:PstS family phosphate ABC transporter substrate-binding protein [Marseilla massiliensis]|jgi:phosphate transport system substrate-binding protein|uniref:Substrate-binding domain-containing protein n=1 Tax=Marseilla massiliensis TaxID=1841864 RepID=A0A938WM32_9BACT|nr:substrate-binding domain-containing protein [Marseilla massiliensis]MBM6662446.1 substrate-binding domain-containing protein [Marseilla massiliensis]MCL1610354.1 substrate-binding domain-containing protein [Marseilla massiliensis]MEE0361645.1 substrate-binding domain-containing protein [Prevotella sp.]
MKINVFNTFVGLTLILGLFASCKDKPKNGRTDTYSSGTIKFVSDESFSPIIDEQREIFEFVYPKAKLVPIYTNELDGVNMLMKEQVYLAITSRNFTDKEVANLEARRFQPIAIPLAFDGLALIVNNSNPDTIISVNDIKQILSGKVAKWKALYPNSKLDSIEVAFDNKQSSTVHYCVDSLLGGKPINSPNIYAVDKSAEVIDFVEKHPNAIGIIGSNWLNDKRDTTNVTFKRNIRVMGVSRIHPATVESSWKPYQYYLWNGNYPLVRTIYALLNDPRHGLPWGFANFMSADSRGQRIFFKAGLLPYRGNMTVREVSVSDE